MRSAMDIRLLGPVEAHRAGRRVDLGPRKQRLMFAVLALEVNRVVPVDRLVELVWPVDPPRTVEHAVQVGVSRLRAAFGTADPGAPVGIDRRGAGYVLRADPESVDAHRFRASLARAAAADDDELRIRVLTEALDLWSGSALSGTVSAESREQLCGGLDEARLTAVEDRLAARLRLGQHRAVLDELIPLVPAYPARERLVTQLMLALHRSGQTSAALEAYREARRRLADELGLDPGSELHELHLAILRGDPSLDLLPRAASGAVPGAVPGSAPGTERIHVPAQLPLVVPSFAGRSRELAELDAVLAGRDGTSVTIVAISGTAGVGKTALAGHWAHRVAGRFPDGQLHVNLRGFDPGAAPVDPAEAVRGFLDALGVPAARVPVGREAQAALYRTVLAGKRVLVVLDNAYDVEQVRPLLPASAGCLVVVTSRRQLVPLVATEGAHPLTVDLLPEAEARDLLVRRIGAPRVAAEPEAVDEIIVRSAQLPLALAIAAARAATRPRIALAALAAELRDAASALDGFDAGDPATDVRTVLSWSYRTVSEGAATLFRLLGLHPGPDISAPAAASLLVVPPRQARPLLAELVGAHLLTEHKPGRYSHHDLLRAYAIELVGGRDTAEVRRAATHRMLDHYLHSAYPADRSIFPHADPIALAAPVPGVTPEVPADAEQAMAWFAAEYPVLLGVIERAPAAGFDGHTWRLARSLATYLDWSGHWIELAATHHTALDAARRSGDRAAEGYVLRCLGIAYGELHRLEDAYLYNQQALELAEELGDYTQQAQAHLNLSRASEHLGRLADALEHSHQALKLYRAAGHRVGQARALNNIGWGHAQLGDYRQALVHCGQALVVHQELGDAEGEANTWDSLGYAHRHLGDFTEAVACYSHTLDLYRAIGDRGREAETLGFLGDTHHDAGDRAAAADAWTRAVEIFDELDRPRADELRVKLRGVGPVR
jgi:DNA-binding SARP family transcriptional activator/tetratricopeptide (TPR) repeat protein